MKTIHIFIGTKAQFIKVAPIIKELDKRNLPYRLIDSCQHKDITTDLRRLFDIREPDVYLYTGFNNINTLIKAFLWTARIMGALIIKPNAFKQEVFGNSEKGLCLIHGDTLSTLLGLIIAKRYGFEVGHLEAGLRSFDIVNPFPEELIRIICMRYADFLFAPSDWAYDNLTHLRKKATVYNIKDNTIFDSIRYILPRSTTPAEKPHENYVIMSIHRFENIYQRKRLASIVTFAAELSEQFTVIFVAHQPTLKRLKATSLLHRLKQKKITIASLAHYDAFLSLLADAQFIITDGGSIQEESYYLNKPCLLLRNKTERHYGLGENVCLSQFNKKILNYFTEHYPSFKRKDTPKHRSSFKCHN